MKRLLIVCAILVVAVAVFGLRSETTYAFHDGGVAECSGCHSMHSSPAADNLLINTDESSTCLSCHEDDTDTGPTRYHVSTAATSLAAGTDIPLQRSPGGDFGWLRQTFSAPASYGGGYVIINNPGGERGHNITAADNGYAAPAGTAPGGTMPANQLACTSCHDPHGRARRSSTGVISSPTIGSTHDPIFESGSYGFIPPAGEAAGTYRLLGGFGYQAFDSGPTYPGVPAAVVNSDYNRDEGSQTTRAAYGHGTTNGYTSWGLWCATCHPGMHEDSASNLVHSVDGPLAGGVPAATNYNAYVKTGDLTGVFPRGGPFTSLVPFASNTADVATLEALAQIDDSQLGGPAATDRMACLTCHRAHASGWKYALRWNGEAEFLTLGDIGTPIYPGEELAGTIGNQGQFNRGMTSAQMEAAYNGRAANREFSAHQRSLCNKCHLND